MTAIRPAPPMSAPAIFLALFAASSAAAVVLGCVAAARSGVPVSLWARDPAAWLIGGLMGVGLATRARPAAVPVVLGVALAALAATLFGAGMSGVHRWIVLGPFRFNAAETVLPAAVVAWTVALMRPGFMWIAVPASALLLAAQPDASQAIALAGAAGVGVALTPAVARVRWTVLAAAVVGAAVALLRPDPLAPVPEVEGIVGVAYAMSPLLAGLSILALAACIATPLALWRSQAPGVRAAAAALAAYGALAAIAPVFGAFPVPLLGVAPSPIVGAWLGAGLLAGLARGGA